MASEQVGLNLDRYGDTQIVDLAHRVKEAWAPRDAMIDKATELRNQTWKVEVPDPWRQTARVFHSAQSKVIPARVVGTVALREPTYSRTPPDDDVGQAEKAASVERFLSAMFQWTKRNALAGKNAYMLSMDMLVNKGAVCAGSIFAPHSWASIPAFSHTDEPNKVRREWWRDESGVETDEAESVSERASVNAYMKAVDRYRRIAKPPILRRILDTHWSYPLFVEGEMLALFVFRSISPLELVAGGFVLPEGDADDPTTLVERNRETIEVITPNRFRYYVDRDPVRHRVFGSEGVVHNYGFVPYSYRVGMESGELEYGNYGTPLLSLIDSHLRLIDTLETYALNAVHLAAFPSFQVVYETRGDTTTISLVESQSGRKVTSYDFKSGQITDLGPGRRIEPLLHPGMNKDFYEYIRFMKQEIKEVIPDTLQGVAASSGYNTVQATVQARSLFEAIAAANEMHHQDLAEMDMRHVERTPGPIYMNLAMPRGIGGTPRKVERVRISASDIGHYYAVDVQVDREIDRITLAQVLENLRQGGVVDKDAVREAIGVTDTEQMRYRVVRDRVEDDPEILAVMKQRALRRFGLAQLRQEADAMAQISLGQDGTPLVQLPDGRMAGPGLSPLAEPTQSPQAQGMQGAVLGGMNAATPMGRENMGATRNPNIGLAAPTPTGRGRGRRRGGAIPGAPQRQGSTRPVPENAAAP